MAIDVAWAREQARAAGMATQSIDLVGAILSLVNESRVQEPAKVLRALQAATSLSQGEAMEPLADDREWVAVRPGEYRSGSEVRVRLHAYAGEVGQQLNGRIGKVIRPVGKDALVRIDGVQSTHSLSALERPL